MLYTGYFMDAQRLLDLVREGILEMEVQEEDSIIGQFLDLDYMMNISQDDLKNLIYDMNGIVKFSVGGYPVSLKYRNHFVLSLGFPLDRYEFQKGAYFLSSTALPNVLTNEMVSETPVIYSDVKEKIRSGSSAPIPIKASSI